jgi:hypothetical protein
VGACVHGHHVGLLSGVAVHTVHCHAGPGPVERIRGEPAPARCGRLEVPSAAAAKL